MVCAEATSPQSQDGAHAALRACVSWKRYEGSTSPLNHAYSMFNYIIQSLGVSVVDYQGLSVYHILALIGRTIFFMVSFVFIKPTPLCKQHFLLSELLTMVGLQPVSCTNWWSKCAENCHRLPGVFGPKSHLK